VSDEVYAKECGSCHFTYMPGMLPERSWRKLMSTTDKHFGESLSLAPDVASHIESYLVANAADHSPYRGSELILWDLPRESAPTRITTLPLMRQRHTVIRKLMADTNTPFKALSNCETCHENAASGSFAYDHIVIPGISKVVRPGGMF
jgi:Dihaem cytochrome c